MLEFTREDGSKFQAGITPTEVLHTKNETVVNLGIEVAGVENLHEAREVTDQIAQSACQVLGGLEIRDTGDELWVPKGNGKSSFGFIKSTSTWLRAGKIQGGWRPVDKYPSPSSGNPLGN